MKYIITILSLFSSLLGFSQYEKTSELITIGDSVLCATVGSMYRAYYKLDTTSYYEYKNIFNQSISRQLVKNNKIRKRFDNASIRFRIDYPEIRELSSMLFVNIDKHGTINRDVKYIPQFILENRECEFVPKTSIDKIADSLLKEKGTRIEYKLYAYYNTNEYIWEIDNIIRDCNENGFIDGEMEVIIINPITEEIIEHKIYEFGRVF